MKKVLMIAHFCSDFQSDGNNRFNYLAELLSESFDVELVTTDFSHVKKSYREKKEFKSKFKITMLHESAYNKNVSIKRLAAHFRFGKNVSKYLSGLKEKPDVIYCAVPSLDAAVAAAKYAKRNNIKFIIDIQDLWPEAFQMVLNIPLFFYPMKKKADYVYKAADEVIAVSQTYCDRAKKVNAKTSGYHPVYLGTNLNQFDKNVSDNLVMKPDNEIWIGYCGTLGSSYDLKCAINAIAVLKEQGYNVKFQVMGDGPLRNDFESYAVQKGIHATFTGYISYPQMCGLLAACDIAINPIVHGAAQSIINKHADYAAAGIPVISSQESKEYRELVDEYEMGFNCVNGNAKDMAKKIEMLICNSQICEQMGKNARKCAEERFSRACTYQEIADLIEELGSAGK